MDGVPENEENGVKNDTKRLKSADSSNEETVQGVPAEMAAPDHDEENSEGMRDTEDAPVEEAATSQPEENSENELAAVGNIPTSEDLSEKISEDNEQPVSHEDSVIFENNSNDEDEPPRLHRETSERENISPTQEDKAEVEERTAAPADKEDIRYEEHVHLLQQLCEERDKASQRSSQLQMELVEYFRISTGNDAQLESEVLVSDQQEYEKYIDTLTDMKLQLTTDSETAQQHAEELALQAKEKLDMVENEWRAFVALKQDVAVTVLSQLIGKHTAQAKVGSVLAEEQLRQDELIKLRLKNIKLSMKIHRLEAELCDVEDPQQLQFELLQAERLRLRKQNEKEHEESLKMQKKMRGSLVLLSNIKEKLFWSQMDVQAKREQLAEVEAMLARKRDLLTRTKQARSSLQRDNLRLKEHRGLLGNRVLLRDFEDTVDTSDHLEKQLENLKDWQPEIVFRCGRWKKKPETT